MTSTYSLNAGQIIVQSYRKIGALASPWVLSPDQIDIGLVNLNIMLKGLQIDGMNLFRQTQITMAIPSGQGFAGTPYQVTPLILNLADGRLIIQPAPNLYERPLGVYSYEDYMLLPNKMQANTSGPSIIAFDRQTTVSNIYIWPLATNGCTVNATVARTINDVNTVNDPIDVPIEWSEGIVWMLADRLLDDTGIRDSAPTTSQSITAHATAFYQKLLNFDRPDFTNIRPMGKTGNSRIWRY